MRALLGTALHFCGRELDEDELDEVPKREQLWASARGDIYAINKKNTKKRLEPPKLLKPWLKSGYDCLLPSCLVLALA